MEMLKGNTPQDRQNEVVRHYVRRALTTEFPFTECSECGIDIYPSHKFYQRNSGDLCENCVPKCKWVGCEAPQHDANIITETEFCLDHDIEGWLDELTGTVPDSEEHHEVMKTVNLLLAIKGGA